MAVTETIEVGSYGRDLILQAGNVVLSDFDVLEALVYKPDSTPVTSWPLTILNPGAIQGAPDYGDLTYTITSGDLDEVGSYKIHVKLTRTSPAMVAFGKMAVLKVVRLGERTS